MKTLKFTTKLIPLILSGEKTRTFRLFDDKDLHKGDMLEFIHKEKLAPFGRAIVISVYEKKLEDLDKKDLEGHEKFESDAKMLNEYKKYYGDTVTLKSIVKIIDFRLTQNFIKNDKLDLWNKNKKNVILPQKYKSFHELEIWFIKMGENVGFEQNGSGTSSLRPVLVYKKFSKNAFLGIPLTHTKRDGWFYAPFAFKGGVSVAILSQIRLFSSHRLAYSAGKVSDKIFDDIKQKLITLLQ